MQRTVKARFYPELESLRGIASAAVLLGHCYLFIFPTWNYLGADFAWLHAVIAGLLDPQPAVLLFFVLSGFVLGAQLENAPVASPVDYIAYMARRLLRLMPAMWLSLGLALALKPSAAHLFWPGLVFLSFDINIVIWTLYVELIGSALLSVMALVAVRAGPVANALVLAALTLACLFVTWPLAPAFLVFFFAGLLIGHAPAGFNRVLRGPFGAAAGIAALVTYVWAPAIAISGIRNWNYWAWHPWMWLEIPACVIIVHSVMTQRFGWITACLNTRPLRFLGRISFSLYLLHFPILTFVYLSLPKIGMGLPAQPSAWDRLLTVSVLTPPVIILSVAAAWAAHRFVEAPSTAAGRRVADAIRGRQATAR